MLQVSTGKFYDTDDLHVTEHRGILYTNYRQHGSIETVVGTLLPSDPGREISCSVCETVERLPRRRPDGEDAILVSVGSEQLLQDFSAVTSFSLNLTISPKRGLVKRLTATRNPPLGIAQTPNEYVGRVFDRQVRQRSGDASQLRDFTAQLVGLERAEYERAIRAIRQYVMALRRIVDDLSLSYAMLVAAIESLAQDFEDFGATWEDVADHKRGAVEHALEPAAEDVTEQVREAILEYEHHALSRRFVEFTLDHLEPSFFREEARDEPRPIRRSSLPIAMKRAYGFRSRYLHGVQELPRQLTHMPSNGDVRRINRRPTLTLHGLARVGKHVIQRFVERAPKVEEEDFNYREALPNVVEMRMATKYWLWRADGYDHSTARRYLSGLLQELANSYQEPKEPELTDIGDVLQKIEDEVAGLALPEQRLPMLTMYLLWNEHISEEHRQPSWDSLIEEFEEDFLEPSIESLLVHVISDEGPPWPMETCEEIWADYLDQRHYKKGLAIPQFFEAMICLSLAERSRDEGNDAWTIRWIGRAVEALPGNDRIMELEKESQAEGEAIPAIDWRKALTSNDADNENSADQ